MREEERPLLPIKTRVINLEKWENLLDNRNLIGSPTFVYEVLFLLRDDESSSQNDKDLKL